MSLSNSLKKILKVPAIVTGLVGITLTGCNQKIIESEKLFEDAKVVRMEHRDSYTTRKYGMKYDGEFGMKTIHHPEKNIIEFDGEVDFDINNREVYNKFNMGDSARVSYKESYLVTFEDLDKDGKKEETKRISRGYRFLGAEKK